MLVLGKVSFWARGETLKSKNLLMLWGGGVPLALATTQPAPHANKKSACGSDCSLCGQSLAVSAATPTAGTPRNAPTLLKKNKKRRVLWIYPSKTGRPGLKSESCIRPPLYGIPFNGPIRRNFRSLNNNLLSLQFKYKSFLLKMQHFGCLFTSSFDY